MAVSFTLMHGGLPASCYLESINSASYLTFSTELIFLDQNVRFTLGITEGFKILHI